MKSRSILVVDDDLAFTTPLIGFLEGEGFRVRSANTGVEALEAIAEERPDLVLLDMYLPMMDGWEFARELRARDIAIPIVVTTAAHQARQAAEEIGAAAYVPKPLSLPMLLQRITALCA
jgi:CheY-like chemotaxis protein